jgi:hypothetical protein
MFIFRQVPGSPKITQAGLIFPKFQLSRRSHHDYCGVTVVPIVQHKGASSLLLIYTESLGASHTIEVLDRQEVEVEESVDAVADAGLLGGVQPGLLDRAGDALLPANVGQDVGLGLDLRALLLVGEELAKLGLVLVVELLEISRFVR